MSSSTRLGRCPRCGAGISTACVLIEYETIEGPNAYAECPDCFAVVHPE